MDLKKLIEVVNEAYDADGIILSYFEKPRVNHGDFLAKFIYSELRDTFEKDAKDEDQVEEALRVMRVAWRQLGRVVSALEEL